MRNLNLIILAVVALVALLIAMFAFDISCKPRNDGPGDVIEDVADDLEDAADELSQ
jgi:Flp pilus assembly protein CpaB